MDIHKHVAVWHNVEHELNRRMPEWHRRIALIEQIPALEQRESGRAWTDHEVFEALVLSLLTNSVDWSKIQRIRHELEACFCGFDPVDYSKLQSLDVEERLAWLKERKASAPYQRQGLRLLVKAAEQLLTEKRSETMDEYIASLCVSCDGQPIKLAIRLGSGQSPQKLPGMGIPLAAEFLKNLGYDIAKPDRHICRALGEFGWVAFRRWPERATGGPPSPSEKEMVAVMQTLEELARIVGEHTTFVDNALWLLCARSGLRVSNEELRRLGEAASEGAAPHARNGPLDGSHIDPKRADRYTWRQEDVEIVSDERSRRL